MKKLVLVGADGQLGSEIYKLARKKFRVVALKHTDLDITHHKKVKSTLLEIKPDLIINTAAYHKVDEIEKNPKKAYLVNGTAQQNLAKISNEINSIIVYISTDYVFGQNLNRTKPYIENDPCGPLNIYGISKIIGEEVTRIYSPRHFIIRTSGLYGQSKKSQKGDNFVERMIKLSESENELNVVNDQTLSPTYTKNLSQNLLSLIENHNFGTYHMASGGHCSWWQFAQEIFKLLKIKIKCNPVSSDFFTSNAKRPKYSVLNNYNLEKIKLNKMLNWRENLKQYLVDFKHL